MSPLSQNRKKQVLHFANYKASYRGNFIESLECLDEKLQANNIEMIYLFSCTKEKAPEWMLEMETHGKKLFFLTGNKRADRQLLKRIKKENRIDLVHAHFLNGLQLRMLLQCFYFQRDRVLIHFHNHAHKAEGIKKFIRSVLYKGTGLIGCSASVCESIQREYDKNRIYRADNGVYFERISSLKAAGHAEYGLSENSYKLLIFGFDFYRKGVDLAIRAIDQCRRSEKNLELLISSSQDTEKTTQYIREYWGSVPEWVHVIPARNDVMMLYNLADIFLSPSREEGLPYSVVEAAYCQCDVIMSDIHEQADLKIPYGVWHKKEDADDLAKTISMVLDRKGQKQRDLGNVRQQLERDYSLEKWADQILKIYEEYGIG